MDRYIIKQAYPWQNENVYELEICSDNLIYTELGDTHSGVQVMNDDNKDLIHLKLRQVADLIREIDQLNQIPKSSPARPLRLCGESIKKL